MSVIPRLIRTAGRRLTGDASESTEAIKTRSISRARAADPALPLTIACFCKDRHYFRGHHDCPVGSGCESARSPTSTGIRRGGVVADVEAP